MKLEIGKKYRVEDHSEPWEVVVIDCRGIGWGLLEGYIRSSQTLSIITEWQDKPDPGEGWRLLEVGEKLQEGDEFLCPPHGNWHVTGNPAHGAFEQSEDTIYRRRIAPQYVPYTWDDRDELRGRWYRRKHNKDYEREDQVKSLELQYNSRDFYINGVDSKRFWKVYEWLDGTPCGKKVV